MTALRKLPKDIREAIGRRLRSIRRSRKIRQESVCAAVGISISSLNDYELGIHEPSLGVLIKLCKLYRVQSDYILLLRQTPFDGEQENQI